MRTSLLMSVAAATFAAGLAMNAGAAPVPADPPESPAMQSQSQTAVSQAELRKFAATYQAVSSISDRYTPKVRSAKNKQQAQKIADVARQKMKDAIKQHGFTLGEYGNIVEAINSNPQLHKRFAQMVQGGGAGQ